MKFMLENNKTTCVMGTRALGSGALGPGPCALGPGPGLWALGPWYRSLGPRGTAGFGEFQVQVFSERLKPNGRKYTISFSEICDMHLLRSKPASVKAPESRPISPG